jgi:hypothetical protein
LNRQTVETDTDQQRCAFDKVSYVHALLLLQRLMKSFGWVLCPLF